MCPCWAPNAVQAQAEGVPLQKSAVAICVANCRQLYRRAGFPCAHPMQEFLKTGSIIAESVLHLITISQAHKVKGRAASQLTFMQLCKTTSAAMPDKLRKGAFWSKRLPAITMCPHAALQHRLSHLVTAHTKRYGPHFFYVWSGVFTSSFWSNACQHLTFCEHA